MKIITNVYQFRVENDVKIHTGTIRRMLEFDEKDNPIGLEANETINKNELIEEKPSEYHVLQNRQWVIDESKRTGIIELLKTRIDNERLIKEKEPILYNNYLFSLDEPEKLQAQFSKARGVVIASLSKVFTSEQIAAQEEKLKLKWGAMADNQTGNIETNYFYKFQSAQDWLDLENAIEERLQKLYPVYKMQKIELNSKTTEELIEIL